MILIHKSSGTARQLASSICCLYCVLQRSCPGSWAWCRWKLGPASQAKLQDLTVDTVQVRLLHSTEVATVKAELKAKKGDLLQTMISMPDYSLKVPPPCPCLTNGRYPKCSCVIVMGYGCLGPSCPYFTKAGCPQDSCVKGPLSSRHMLVQALAGAVPVLIAAQAAQAICQPGWR